MSVPSLQLTHTRANKQGITIRYYDNALHQYRELALKTSNESETKDLLSGITSYIASLPAQQDGWTTRYTCEHTSLSCFLPCSCDICHNSQGIRSSLLLLIPLLTHASITHSTFQLLQGNLHVFADTDGVRAHEVSFSLTNATVSSAASGIPSFLPFLPSICNTRTTRVSALQSLMSRCWLTVSPRLCHSRRPLRVCKHTL